MSDEPLRFERGDLSLTIDEDGTVNLARPHPEIWVGLDADELRWLVLTVGPAALYALAPPKLNIVPREDAGPGGGPGPAAAEATEPPDEQLGLEVT